MKIKAAVAIVLFVSIISFILACKDKEVKVDKDEEIVVLIEEPSKSYYREGQRIEFTGSGANTEGEVDGSNLQWTSDIDGVIGNGISFYRDDLSLGVHEITLTAVNEGGEQFADSTTIEIFKRKKQKRAANKKERWFRRITDPVDGGLYIEVHDGTVVDMSTGLMWEKSPDNALRSFYGAVEYAKNLRLGGYRNWTIPSVAQLRSISNINFSPGYRRMLNLSGSAVVRSAAICNVFDTMNGHFWAVDASKPYIVIANKRYGHAVKYQFSSAVNYFRGTYVPYSFDNPGYVRCVRYCDLKKWRRLLAKSG
jgi:hypothetical protein